MSKKIENETVETAENAVEYTHILDAIRANGGIEPGLRAIAMAAGVSPNRLYAIAKKPVAGAVYDPTVTNWDAINTFICNKLTAAFNADITTMEDFVVAAQAQQEIINTTHVRAAGSGESRIEVDGELIPKRKSVKFEMGDEQESLICFKHDGNVYKIVYQTQSYTVLRPVNSDNEFAADWLKVVSNTTLNTKCVAPLVLADGIQARFDGTYQEDAPKTEGEDADVNDGENEVAEG